MRWTLPIAGVLLVLALPGPAGAQDEVGLLDPSAAAGAPLMHRGDPVGELVVVRTGSSVEATVTLDRRPPGRHLRVCVSVAGVHHCTTRGARRDRAVRVRTTADFAVPLRAWAGSGRARARVRL